MVKTFRVKKMYQDKDYVRTLVAQCSNLVVEVDIFDNGDKEDFYYSNLRLKVATGDNLSVSFLSVKIEDLFNATKELNAIVESVKEELASKRNTKNLVDFGEIYDQIKPALIAAGFEKQYVVISHNGLVGVRETRDEAIRLGCEKFGIDQAYLVKAITKEEKIERI